MIHRNYKYNLIYWFIFGAGLVALFFLQYYGLLKFHYPVPPGDDPVNHWKMSLDLINSQNINLIDHMKSGLYPPLFHILIAKLAGFFSTDSMQIMLWITPSLTILAAISIFIFAYSAFGRIPGLIAFFLYGFVARSPIQLLNDGGYPNILAAHILLPLLFWAFYMSSIRSEKVKKTLFIALSVSICCVIVLTHHLSTLYMIAAMLVLLPVYTIVSWFKNKWPKSKGLLIVGGNIILYSVFFIIFFKTDLFDSAKQLFLTAINSKAHNSLYFSTYLELLGIIITFFAMIGAVPLFFVKKIREKPLPYLLIFSLALVLVFASRLSFLENPDRPVRDLAFPGAIIAALAIENIFLFLEKDRKYRLAAVLMVIILITLFSKSTTRRIANAIQYEPMVRSTSADIEAFNFLRPQSSGKVLVEGYNFYFDYYLPEWEIRYLWLPPGNDARPLDPKITEDRDLLLQYDYLYLVDSQNGWTPSQIPHNFSGLYVNQPSLQQVGKFESQTNTTFLFKIKK